MEQIGILTAGRRPDHIGGNMAHFRRLGHLGERMGLSLALYHLQPAGAYSVYHWSSRRQEYVPSPVKAVTSVLYNRIPSRGLERLPAIQERLQMWKHEGTVITNPQFLSKWDLDQTWRQDEQVRPYLPDTERLLSATQLATWLQKREQFYLKPIAGKAGIGMMHIRHVRSGYQLREQQKGALIDYGELSQRELLQLLQQRHIYSRYLLQEEMTLARWQGRRFDVRMLLHRRPDQGFLVSGLAVRSAPGDFITTHVPNGGSRAPADKTLMEVFGERGVKLQSRLESVAQTAANSLTRLPGDWCELSLDASMTPDGRPVLFEANAKPMKFDEVEIETRGKKRLLESLAMFAGL